MYIVLTYATCTLLVVIVSAVLFGFGVIVLVVAVHIRSNGPHPRPASFFEVVGESYRITQNLSELSWKDYCDLVCSENCSAGVTPALHPSSVGRLS